jgi:hypothetical protein
MKGTITTRDLADAMDCVRAQTAARSIQAVEQDEPELYGFIMAAIHCVSGRLALVDVPNSVIQENATEVLELVTACLLVTRIGVEREIKGKTNGKAEV